MTLLKECEPTETKNHLHEKTFLYFLSECSA